MTQVQTQYSVMIPKHVGNRVEVKLFDGRSIIIEFDEHDIYIQAPNVHSVTRTSDVRKITRTSADFLHIQRK